MGLIRQREMVYFMQILDRNKFFVQGWSTAMLQKDYRFMYHFF